MNRRRKFIGGTHVKVETSSVTWNCQQQADRILANSETIVETITTQCQSQKWIWCRGVTLSSCVHVKNEKEERVCWKTKRKTTVTGHRLFICLLFSSHSTCLFIWYKLTHWRQRNHPVLSHGFEWFEAAVIPLTIPSCVSSCLSHISTLHTF